MSHWMRTRPARAGWIPVLIAGGALLTPAPLLWAAQAFQESAGQVVMEAENADANIARSGKTWTLETAITGYSGSGYLTALPNSDLKNNTGYTTASPELQYNVNFSTTGTYYVWIRGYGSSGSDDSIHAGIDGTGPASADRISSFPASWTWSRNTSDSAPATLTVSSPGLHTIHLWMREDGFKVDKLLLRTSSSSTAPSGTGPAQSARVTATDTSPPSQPATPTEGSASDADYDSDGAYTIYWTAASDGQSGVSAYELQERVGATGVWTTLTSTTTATSFAVTGKLHNTRYYYHVRARNGDGVWGSWSTDSDGVLVDTTIPIPPSVTDDGATTSSTTTLHATWQGASDPESGITEYRYRIRRDANNGTIIRDYTSVGLATEVTATGLTLVNGVTYFIGIRAFNGAGLFDSNYSNGITISAGDTTPPAITNVTVSTITTSSATISWTTDEPATSQVEYGLTTGYGQLTPLDSALLTNHSVTLSGLTEATLYHFRVRSTDGANNPASSADQTFTTTAPADTTPPTGTITINGAAAATNSLTVTLTLSATDNSGSVSQMQFSSDGTTYTAPEAYAATKSWTLTAGDGVKTVYAKFKDAAGNWSVPASDTITLDTTPPTLSITSPADGAVIVAP